MTEGMGQTHDAEVPHAAEAGRYDAFLSYSRIDSAFAVDRLRASLLDRGLEVWLDVEDIQGGALWRERIHGGIEACKAFLFVISPDSLSSEACLEELALAADAHKLIIPIQYRPPGIVQLPAALSEAEWIFLGDVADRDGMDKLVAALETDLAWRDQHTRLAGRAREWLDGERDRSYLLRGSDLREAEAWLAQQEGHREQPTVEQTEYIARSRQAAGRRLATLIGAMSIAVAVSVALAIVALIQRGSAVKNQHIAQSRALSAEATEHLNSDPVIATRLALRAVQTGATPGAVLALRQAVGADQLRHVSAAQSTALTDVQFDPANPSILAAVAANGTVAIWNASTGKLIARHANPITPVTGYRADVAFTPDGRYVLAGDSAGQVRAWRVRDGEGTAPLLPLVKGGGGATAIAASVAGGVVGTRNGYVTFRPNAGAKPQVFHIARSSISGLTFSPDHTGLLISVTNGAVVLADIRDGQISNLRVLRDAGAPKPLSAAFSPSGRRIMLTDNAGNNYLWDAAGKLLAMPRLSEPKNLKSFSVTADPALSFAFSRDGTLIAVAYVGGEVAIFRASDGRLVNVISSPLDSGVTAITFLPLDYLAVSYADGVTREVDAATGTQIGVLGDGSGRVLSLSANATGTLIATVALDGRLRLWNALAGRPLSGILPAKISSLAPNGRSLVWISGTTVKELTGKTIRSLGSASDSPNLTQPWFSADSRVMALAQKVGITLVNLHTGAGSVRLPDSAGLSRDPNFSLSEPGAFNPDGTRLVAPVAGGHGTIWSAITGRIVGRLPTGDAVLDETVYSPSGTQIAAAAENGTTYLMPASASGHVLRLTNPPAAGPVASVAFSPNGQLLATATDFIGNLQDEVRLWSTKTGRPVGPALTGYGGMVAFSPDGSAVAVQDVEADVSVVPVTGTGLDPAAVEKIRTGESFGAAFAAGDQLIAATVADGPAVFDIASGQLVERIGVTRNLEWFSVAGDKVLAGSDTTSQLFDCTACGPSKQVIDNAQ